MKQTKKKHFLIMGSFIRRQLYTVYLSVIKASLLDGGILLLFKLLVITFLNVFFTRVVDKMHELVVTLLKIKVFCAKHPEEE